MVEQKKSEVKPTNPPAKTAPPATPPAGQPPPAAPTVQLTEKQVSAFLEAQEKWTTEKTSLQQRIAQAEHRAAMAEQEAKKHAEIIAALDANPEQFVTEQIAKRNVNLEGVAQRITHDPNAIVLDELKKFNVRLDSLEKGVTERVSTVDESTKRFQYALQLQQLLTQERFANVHKASKIVAFGARKEPDAESLTDVLFDDAKRLKQPLIPVDIYAENLLKESDSIIAEHGKYFKPVEEQPPTALAPAPVQNATPPSISGIAPLNNADETAMLSPEDLRKMPEDERIKYVLASFAAKNKQNEELDKEAERLKALEVGKQIAEQRRATDRTEIAAFGPPLAQTPALIATQVAPTADQMKQETVPLQI
jgi:hypothetical protein